MLEFLRRRYRVAFLYLNCNPHYVGLCRCDGRKIVNWAATDVGGMRNYSVPAAALLSFASVSGNESNHLVDRKCAVCGAETCARSGRGLNGELLCPGCVDEQTNVAKKQPSKETEAAATEVVAVSNIPEHLQRFVVARPGQPTYMRCDRCDFLCRPFALLFEKHYLAHEFENQAAAVASGVVVSPDEELASSVTAASHFDGDDDIQCAICDKVFLRKGSLIAHLRRHDELTCKLCFATFKSVALLKSHKKRHVRRKLINNTLIYCDVCKKYFKTKKGYAYHREKICVQYKCYVCNKTFAMNSALQDHVRRVHDVEQNLLNEVRVPRDNETLMSVCTICGKAVTHAVLPRHMVLHDEARPFACDLCGKRFKRKNSLQDHIMIEMGMKNYVCEVCGMKFLKQGYLNKHVRYHKLNNGEFQGFQCEVCGKRFPEKWRLGVHQRAVHKGGEFASCRCDICDKKFAERWMVRKHKHLEHNGEEFKEYVCDICGKTFQEKWMIKSHQRSTHRGGVLRQYCDLCGRADHTAKDCAHRHALQEVKCVLCGESFSSTYFLKEHVTSTHSFEVKAEMKAGDGVNDGDGDDVKSFSGNDPLKRKQNVLYICANCGLHFADKNDLRAHEMEFKCGGEGKYECTECGIVYTSKFSLSNHLMIHKKASTLVPFKCALCDRDFFTHEALDKHQSLPKICLLCDKVYPCNDHLKNHVFGEHKDDELDDTSSTNVVESHDDDDGGGGGGQLDAVAAEKQFECKLCRKKFARKQAMKNHLFAEMNLRRYVCEFCDKSYNYYSHLKEHIITNHGEKEFVCGYCGKDFPTKKRFRDHVTLHSEEKPFRCTCGLAFKLSRYLNKHKKHCKTLPND